jgi:hypothetical protein
MKLGGKSRDVDSFVDQLKEEGETVTTPSLPTSGYKFTQISSDAAKTEQYDCIINVFFLTPAILSDNTLLLLLL